ncbi:MAG: alpha-methylacyl-CoA racemase [Myxococcota bacterium]|jgi:alpha-methylacyl-CoA racemase
MSQLPLEGLTVVDFSRLLPGPYATLVLADLGATVVKVEDPRGGDYLRWMPPLTSAASGKKSYAFCALNGGKRSLALDLKKPGAAEVISDLVADADIVLESFRPGVMDRLGIGYEALSQRNPRLIYCAISGFGQDGPYRERPGHDINYAAIAGVVGLAGPADAPPAVSPVQTADYGGSLWSLVAILTALHARERTGKGQFLDVSMTDGVMGLLSATLAPHLAGGAPAPVRGADTLTGGQPCYGVYETKDGGHYTVAPLEPKFWKAFCDALERPDLVPKQYIDPAGLRAELTRLFKTRTRAEWQTVLGDAGACCEPALRPEELAEHPLHQARHNIIADTTGLKRLRTPTRPVDAPPPEGAPGLGEQSAAILASLGYDQARIDALFEARVVSGPRLV